MSSTASATCSRPPSPAVRTRPEADDGLLGQRPGPRTSSAPSSASTAFSPSAAIRRSRPALAELARFTGDPKYLEQARLFVERRGYCTLADIEYGRDYFQDDVPVRDTTVLTRARGPRQLPGGRGGRRCRRWRGRAAPGRSLHPVGQHGCPPHLRHRWPGSASSGRGVRRGLGTAPGPRVLRDVRRRRLHHVHLAVAASARRAAIRGPHRTHAVQRGRHLAVGRRHGLLLRTHPAPARAGHRAGRRTRCPPRASSSLRATWFEVSCCPPNVARTLASLGAYVATAMTTGCRSTSTPAPRSGRTCPTAVAWRSMWTPPTPRKGRS